MRDSRRRWELALAPFCALTVGFLVYRDLTLPRVGNVEVWLGFELRGAWARWSAPIHWAIFAAGSCGFFRGHAWVWRVAPFYAGYVGASHMVWNLTSASGGGLVHGAWQLAVFLGVAVGLDRLRKGEPTVETDHLSHDSARTRRSRSGPP